MIIAEKHFRPFNRSTKPKLDSALIIDNNVDDLRAIEQILRIGTKTQKIHKETDPLVALEYIQSIEDVEMLPEYIFLGISTNTPGAFYFLDQWKQVPPIIRNRCKIAVMSVFFRYQTELDQKIDRYSFITKKITKPFDISQLYDLSASKVA